MKKTLAERLYISVSYLPCILFSMRLTLNEYLIRMNYYRKYYTEITWQTFDIHSSINLSFTQEELQVRQETCSFSILHFIVIYFFFAKSSCIHNFPIIMNYAKRMPHKTNTDAFDRCHEYES